MRNFIGVGLVQLVLTLLVRRCQEEFLKDYMNDLDRQQYVENLGKAESDEEKKNITLEFEAQEMKLRRRSLGNIRFIGELYKIKMLNGKIMHECIGKLLCQTDEESLECLCRLVTTIGQVSTYILPITLSQLRFFSFWNRRLKTSRNKATLLTTSTNILPRCKS